MDEISREEAKQLIDEADSGILTVVSSEPVPCIGSVPTEDRRSELQTEQYRFGDIGDRNR